jgi:hypothetical protein
MPTSYNTNNIEQILNDIQNLQDIEKKLFNSLDDNTLLTTDQQEKIINKINLISEMRLNLYRTLGGLNKIYQNVIINSKNISEQQKQAIHLVESQLNDSKRKLEFLENEKNNKIRLVQINDYYGQKYSEHASLMKYIIYMLIPIIIICFLYNIGLLPSFLFYLLLIVISTIGSIYIIYKLVSIWNRDNMNYQEYDWNFNSKAAPTPKDLGGTGNPWDSPDMNIGTCIGNSCCSPGTIYDDTINKCITTTTNTKTQQNKVVPSNY